MAVILTMVICLGKCQCSQVETRESEPVRHHAWAEIIIVMHARFLAFLVAALDA